jgi:LacI family transcriptional regulator
MSNTQTENKKNLKTVTLQDIADHCGVHVTTVSMAMRGLTKRVNAKTMEQIQKAAVELGYNPALTHFARRMRAERSGERVSTHMISVMVPWNFANAQYFYTMFHGILQEFSRNGYSVFTTFSDDLIGDKAHPPQPMISRGELDGAILLSPSYHIQDTLQVFRCGMPDLPVITMVNQYQGLPCVTADDNAGAYAIARHMLEHGHRELLHFHSHEYEGLVSSNRLRGYERACVDFGLDPGDVLHKCTYFHAYGKDETKYDWVWEAVSKSLADYPGITGIMADNDLVATQIYNALQIGGLRVPDDISLTGFDDTHLIAGQNNENILTTVHVPLFEMGIEAARLMLKILNGEEKPDARRMLPVEFVPRTSVTSPRKK